MNELIWWIGGMILCKGNSKYSEESLRFALATEKPTLTGLEFIPVLRSDIP
jgi:hypothetical protein